MQKTMTPTGFRQMREYVHGKSIFMRERSQGHLRKFAEDMGDIQTNFDWLANLDNFRDKMTYILSHTTQGHVDMAVWDAGYNKAKMQGMDEKAAIRYADSAVVDTQSSSNVSDLPAMQRGGQFKKLFTQILGPKIAAYNLITADMMRVPDGDDSKRKIAQAAIMGGLAVLALPVLIDSAVDAATDDEIEDLEDAVSLTARRAFASGLDTSFPVFSNMASSYLLYGNASTSPVIGNVEQSLRIPGMIGKKWDGVDFTENEIAVMLKSLTLYTGLPTSIIAKWLKFYEGNLKSDTAKRRDNKVRRRQLRVVRKQQKR
jgi:hypothetical protein